MADFDLSSVSNIYNAVDGGDPMAIAGAAAQVVPGGIGGLGEGLTIGEAAMGDPAAILKLATNPQAVVDFVKNYNPIQTTEDVVSIFSKNGVSSDFFARFPFAAFLDNSTYHWKSRQPTLRAMTPVQRVSWFIKGFSDSNYGIGDAILYNDFFGIGLDQNHHVSYDAPNLTFQLAQAYNQTLFKYLFKGLPTFSWDDGNGHHVVTLDQLGIDITKTKDYAQILAQLQAQAKAQYAAYQAQQAAALQAQQDAANKAKMEKIAIIVGIVLLLAVIIYFITKKK